ncbi:MAG: hypothetical protein LN560_04215 [Rickettsia endosymbiont of Sceptobius lativentris]|nr:hypothetical protein [Rickettsia endosymbiont of Sceptobius lativentris]
MSAIVSSMSVTLCSSVVTLLASITTDFANSSLLLLLLTLLDKSFSLGSSGELVVLLGSGGI